ncbi:YjbF family lipoprotein [Gammaproteobacteria bacterium]|jgi:hypothetical protein|nr:YjbF family lipoprotein [Gammaproteobacteria bacterium]
MKYINSKSAIIGAILFSGCSALPYQDQYQLAKNAIWGVPDAHLEEDFISQSPFSFLKVRFGRGAYNILVLSKRSEEGLHWISNDGVQLITNNAGLIIKTVGLQHDVEYIKSTSISLEVVNDISSLLVSFDDPQLHGLGMSAEIERNKLEVIMRVHAPDIGWKFANNFQYTADGILQRSIQSTHPFLPPIEIQYYIRGLNIK